MSTCIVSRLRPSSGISKSGSSAAPCGSHIGARQTQVLVASDEPEDACHTIEEIDQEPKSLKNPRSRDTTTLNTPFEQFNKLGAHIVGLLKEYPVANLIVADRSYHLTPHGQGFDISIIYEPQRGRLIFYAGGWFEDDYDTSRVTGLIADCLGGRVKIETVRVGGKISEHMAYRIDRSGAWSLYSRISFLMFVRPLFQRRKTTTVCQFPLRHHIASARYF
jgi:hypothetical protein